MAQRTTLQNPNRLMVSNRKQPYSKIAKEDGNYQYVPYPRHNYQNSYDYFSHQYHVDMAYNPPNTFTTNGTYHKKHELHSTLSNGSKIANDPQSEYRFSFSKIAADNRSNSASTQSTASSF
eukprot:131203_1